MRLTKTLAVSALGAALGAGLFTAGPAFAATGGTGTDTSAMFCPFEGAIVNPDGSTDLATEANGAGCVVVRATNTGTAVVIALHQVVLAPGWTDQVKDDRSDRVEVRFTQTATGARVEVRIEPGRGIVVK